MRLKKEHRDIVDDFYRHFLKVKFIGSGGCGVFAKLFYLKLKQLGYDPQIVLHLEKGSNPKAQEVYFQLKEKHGTKIYGYDLRKEFINWFHVTVQVGDQRFDSNGQYIPYENKQRIVIDYETLLTMLSVRLNWNYKFDRKKETPKIKRILDKIFVFPEIKPYNKKNNGKESTTTNT